MILGALSVFYRPRWIPLSDDDREWLEANSARALNYGLSRGLKRALERIWAVLRGFMLLAFGWWMGWSGAAMLAGLLFLAILTVGLDTLRYALVKRPLHYCHAREYRVRELLHICHQVENGQSQRHQPMPRPQPLWTLIIASTCTVILVPAIWLGLESSGMIVRAQVLEQFFLPLALIFITCWRVVSALQQIMIVRMMTPGSVDIFLDSDDALDTYAGVGIFSWLMLAGASGPLLIALAIQCSRLSFRLWSWWQLRQSMAMLARRVRQTHPHASGKVTAPGVPGNDDDWSSDKFAPID